MGTRTTLSAALIAGVEKAVAAGKGVSPMNDMRAFREAENNVARELLRLGAKLSPQWDLMLLGGLRASGTGGISSCARNWLANARKRLGIREVSP